MTMTGAEFMKAMEDAEEGKGPLAEIMRGPRCPRGDHPLHEPGEKPEYIRRADGTREAICSDCYYEALGERIEAHPIVSAGIRRG